jgi:hypothetical protein
MKLWNAMPDEKKPKGIIHISGLGQSKQSRSGKSSDAVAPEISRPEMRSRDELAPIARRLAENGDLMKRLKEEAGTDRERASELIDEITRAAQELDRTITDTEGMRVTLILMEMFFGAGGKSDG